MEPETQNGEPTAMWARLAHSAGKVQSIRWGVAILLVVALGALLLVRVRSANQTIAKQPGLSAIGVRAGQTAPDFALTPLSGPVAHTLHLSDLRGHIVVVNFWSPSCAPCRDEAPILARAAQRYAEDGVRFVGVAFDSTRADVQSFVRQYHIPYSCGLDSADTIAVAYGLLAIPVTVVVDSHGTVARTIQGAVSSSTLRQALQSAQNHSGSANQARSAERR